MLVANSFDLWQKDTFFSAAEEVQQSADIMESGYRTWVRARREGLIPQQLDELERELRMALGTAKWQLEEFEKAVRQSYRSQGNNITATRHKQFVSVIEDQITYVETALKESFNMDGKKPFRWVNLNEDECDDLAHFLSGTSKTVPKEDPKLGALITSFSDSSKENCSLESEVTSTQFSNQATNLEIIVENANCCIELEEIKCQGDEIICNRRNWNSPDRSNLAIVIDGDDKLKNTLIEATPKEKGSKPFFWRLRCEDHNGAKEELLSQTHLRMINWINQHLRRTQRSQSLLVSPVQAVPSTRFILVLMLSIFLFGIIFIQ